jgi:hypothetical protein
MAQITVKKKHQKTHKYDEFDDRLRLALKDLQKIRKKRTQY